VIPISLLTPSKEFFVTQREFDEHKDTKLRGPYGWILFYSTVSGYARAQDIVDNYNTLMQGTDDHGKQVELISLQNVEKKIPVIRQHSDEETNPRLPEHVAGADVFLFSDPHSRVSGITVNDDIYRTGQLAYTLKCHGAHRVNAVLPYLPYSRAERTTHLEREAAQAEFFLSFLSMSGVDTILTYGLHNEAVKSFWQPKRMVALSGIDFFYDVFSEMKGDPKAVAVSTDAGGAKATKILADKLGLGHGICSKVRASHQESTEILGVIGNFEGKKTAIVTDDETVTFGSFKNAIQNLTNKNGIERVYAAVSHIKIPPQYLENLVESSHWGLQKLVVTDTVPQDPALLNHKLIEQRSLNNLFTFIINRIHYDFPTSSLFRSGN